MFQRTGKRSKKIKKQTTNQQDVQLLLQFQKQQINSQNNLQMSSENQQEDEEQYDYDYGNELDYSHEQQKLLSQDDLYEVLKQKLADIVSKTQLHESIAFNILNYYNFQDRKIEEEYLFQTPELISALKCQGILQTSQVHLKQKIDCEICQNSSSGISLDCQHSFCNSCWDQMIEVQFSSFIPIVNCLQIGCIQRLPLEYLEKYSQFKQIVIKRFMQNDKSITWCPGLNCNNVYKCYQSSNFTIKCNCGMKFCSKCKLQKHKPIPCDINKKLVNLEESIDFWVNVNASKCPNCAMKIQRTQGCFHLKCPCGQHFCFACSKPWVKDHEASFYLCPYQTSQQNISKFAQEIKFQNKKIDNVVNEWKLFMNIKQFSTIQFNLEKIFEKLQHLIRIMKRYKQLLNYNYYLLEQNNEQLFQQLFESFKDLFNRLIFQITETLENIQFLYTENDSKSCSLTFNMDNRQNQLTEIFDFTDECNQIYNQIKLKKKKLLKFIEDSLIN